MRRPTFFILGAPKCGTTALAQMLAEHPEVYVSRPKEPHFFDAGYDRGLPAYLRDHFGGWDGRGVAGEATPSYLSVPYVAARLRRDVPHARLIAILRNPVQRAYSSWWMLHARGMEPLPFEEALSANEESLARSADGTGAPDEKSWQAQVRAIRAGKPLPIRNYLESGHYARHLRNYLGHFPREQLDVVFSHELQVCPEATIRRLWRHVGVDDAAIFEGAEFVNEAVGSGAQSLLSLARATGVMRLRGLVPEWLKSWAKKRMTSLGDPPPLPAGARAHLLKHFEPHTRELEALLGADLSSWRS
jgi:hypothetical protein